MPTRDTVLMPMPGNEYKDPLNIRPFKFSPELERYEPGTSEQHPLTSIRLLLAKVGSPVQHVPEAHGRRVLWVMESLGNITTSVLIMDRNTKEVFPAHIPGPGELSAHVTHHLMQQLADMAYDAVVLPFDHPKGHVLLFDQFSGLSSCRDYVILGPWCINCQECCKTVDNLCEDCTIELDLEARLNRAATNDELEAAIRAAECLATLPAMTFHQDAMEASYGPR